VRTIYTIVSAAGGRSGTYNGVTSNFAFLTPSLSYDANNVYLTLALLPDGGGSGSGGGDGGSGANDGGGGGGRVGFLMSAYTVNQKAVGAALNRSVAGASGDLAAVIGSLAG